MWFIETTSPYYLRTGWIVSWFVSYFSWRCSLPVRFVPGAILPAKRCINAMCMCMYVVSGSLTTGLYVFQVGVRPCCLFLHPRDKLGSGSSTPSISSLCTSRHSTASALLPSAPCARKLTCRQGFRLLYASPPWGSWFPGFLS